MGFEALLGNRQLKANLKASLEKGHISHFYLISGPKGSGKHTLAGLLAAAILCHDPMKPCLRCHACRRVMENNHPDFITVEDPEHKNVAVKIVREFREDMFILPNESDYKIYLFPQELGLEGQNALLKILEEPPKHGVFILLADTPEKLLPTVRSRCTELNLTPVSPQILRSFLAARFPQADAEDLDAVIRRSGGYPGQAIELLQSGEAQPPEVAAFVEAFTSRSTMDLVRLLVPMERWKRDQALPVFAAWKEALQEALLCRNHIPAANQAIRELSATRSSKDLMDAITNIQKAMDYTQGNVSVAAVCGWLTWVLR